MSKLPAVLQNLPLPMVPSPPRLQSHLQALLRITAASWGLAAPPTRPVLPPAPLGLVRAVAPARQGPPGLRA